jgi:hypothetical protein
MPWMESDSFMRSRGSEELHFSSKVDSTTEMGTGRLAIFICVGASWNAPF